MIAILAKPGGAKYFLGTLHHAAGGAQRDGPTWTDPDASGCVERNGEGETMLAVQVGRRILAAVPQTHFLYGSLGQGDN